MGESIGAVVESAKNLVSPDKITEMVGGLAGNLFGLSPELLALYQEHTVPCLLVAVCLFTLLAFEGYKIFKLLMFVGSSIVFGIGGYWYIAPLIPADFKSMLPNIVNFDALIAILFGLLALFLTKCAYNFMIMVLGGAIGYYIGSTYVFSVLIDYFNTLEFLNNDIVMHVVGGICAAIFVLLFVLLLKHVYILLTSFGGMICAALLTQQMIMPNGDQNIMICCVILGISIAIFAVVRQYREEEKSLEIVF